MAEWFFDSGGSPIAFVSGDNVFSRSGQFVGRLEDGEVWNGHYVGEIVNGDRFLHKYGRSPVIQGMPGLPPSPGMPGLPGSRGAIGLLGGYTDVEIP